MFDIPIQDMKKSSEQILDIKCYSGTDACSEGERHIRFSLTEHKHQYQTCCIAYEFDFVASLLRYNVIRKGWKVRY